MMLSLNAFCLNRDLNQTELDSYRTVTELFDFAVGNYSIQVSSNDKSRTTTSHSLEGGYNAFYATRFTHEPSSCCETADA